LESRPTKSPGPYTRLRPGLSLCRTGLSSSAAIAAAGE
jgi:hypothetical protein